MKITVGDICIRNVIIKIEDTRERTGHKIKRMLVSGEIMDVRTGTPSEIRIEKEVFPDIKDCDVIRYVRSIIKEMVCHEADEQIRVNGNRMFDPHLTPE